jgi:hypothetical protein
MSIFALGKKIKKLGYESNISLWQWDFPYFIQ